MNAKSLATAVALALLTTLTASAGHRDARWTAVVTAPCAPRPAPVVCAPPAVIVVPRHSPPPRPRGVYCGTPFVAYPRHHHRPPPPNVVVCAPAPVCAPPVVIAPPIPCPPPGIRFSFGFGW
ncbi:MAG: hypothetical protein IT581_23535 [Verrucomicrobiales bacterium]|nr:hypothetical protein [Verrucomicrobiales bacterium]